MPSIMTATGWAKSRVRAASCRRLSGSCKELREYRRTTSIVAAMAIIPLIFAIQPLVVVFGLRASASGRLAHEHLLRYMLGIPALVPALIAVYAVVGERQQGTLEPCSPRRYAVRSSCWARLWRR
jgi:hypothetical protein